MFQSSLFRRLATKAPSVSATTSSRFIRRQLHLSPREVDHLQLHTAGRLAQYRLARGVRLNVPEAVALITMQMMEKIRDGDNDVASLMSMGQTLLGRRQVLPGVPKLVKDVQIEATFPDGTKLLTVHSPIAALDGDMDRALEGSFLPSPALDKFIEMEDDLYAPGEVLVEQGNPITINAGSPLVEMSVTNTGDRPIQVGSHYAFVETNKALEFDRRVSIGKRLNVPSGASVRFEPGETKTVTLVEIGGTKRVVSGNRLTDGIASDERADEIMARVAAGNFKHATAAEVPEGMAYVMERSSYADMYGPTTGDCVVLGDTNLKIRVEYDLTEYGDECKFGGGKSLREGMGQVRIFFQCRSRRHFTKTHTNGSPWLFVQATGVHSADALDTVITNALIVDPVTGILKADVGIKGNRIVGIGKAGNPDMMKGVDPNMIVGATTDVIAGEKMILTAGGIDSHVHWIW